MFLAFGRLQLVQILFKDFRGGLDDPQRSSEFVGDHRDETVAQFAQFLFSCYALEQFGFGLFSLRDVVENGLDELPASPLDARQKDLDWNLSPARVARHPVKADASSFDAFL